MKENKIHIAYGFHVNCYHSYRGDTNDNLGFGSDIRIINKILDVLTDFNEKGIPVKGTWDTENFFSLEKILPEYAPEIIEKMKTRVKKYGDENIIMGYNNGALSAMNEEEFTASVERAVTNSSGTGLRDIFGECEKIVRPQEVMFTPSQVKLYNKLGVKALCLYYSCVPFDAFRTIIPQLSDEQAFNPLTYTYKGESMTIVPTYSNSDVCDAGCLRAWVKDLRHQQERNEINRDLLIFINMDADAIFWETIDLGPLTGKIANTDGIRGLVNEVADLPYVVFDTVGGYLKNHENAGEITFTHDTADGNFTGYASWAEKPFNRKVWTSIERARAMAKVTSESDSLSPSFDSRVLLLSTTHFGLATPVLNIHREKKALELSETVIRQEKEKMPLTSKVTVHNITDSVIQCVQVQFTKAPENFSTIRIFAKGLENYTAIPTDGKGESAFLILKFADVKKKYEIEVDFDGEDKEVCFNNYFSTDRLTLGFSNEGTLFCVYADGEKIGDYDFLRSFITYDGKDYDFTNKKVTSLPLPGRSEGVRIEGEINLPGQIKEGNFVFDFVKMQGFDEIFVRTTVNYPYTPETSSISTENSSLGRYSDMKWTQAVPFQITAKLRGDLKVIKRNFIGDVSSFRTQSFPECDSKNKYIASFNHQLTGGFVGLEGENKGLLIANARQVSNSMAHCPMRLEEDKTVRMNPFGTYFGKQRHHHGRAKDQILDVYTLVAAQGKSIAPAYNGNSETAVMALSVCDDAENDPKQTDFLKAFADGAVITCPADSTVQPFDGDNTVIKEAQKDSISENDLRNPVMTGIAGNLGRYIVKGSKAIMHIIFTQLKNG